MNSYMVAFIFAALGPPPCLTMRFFWFCSKGLLLIQRGLFRSLKHKYLGAWTVQIWNSANSGSQHRVHLNDEFHLHCLIEGICQHQFQRFPEGSTLPRQKRMVVNGWNHGTLSSEYLGRIVLSESTFKVIVKVPTTGECEEELRRRPLLMKFRSKTFFFAF